MAAATDGEVRQNAEAALGQRIFEIGVRSHALDRIIWDELTEEDDERRTDEDTSVWDVLGSVLNVLESDADRIYSLLEKAYEAGRHAKTDPRLIERSSSASR